MIKMSPSMHRLPILAICLLVLSSCEIVRGQEPVPTRTPSTEYPFVTEMDPEGDYILRWNFDDREIRFQIQVQTLGYVAFGISENGLMVPADVVVGYVLPDGSVRFKDFHTVSYTSPVEDASQDWQLESGSESNGWTVMAFKRRLDTCDEPDDRPITRDTMQLIYAYDAQDPTSLDALFHHDRRGSRPLVLLAQARPQLPLSNDMQVLEFRNENYTIPSDRPSSFYCRVFNLTHITQKYHAIKVSPILSEATEYNVNKLILYRCKITDPAISVRTGEGSDCFTDAPNHVQFCREYVAGFGANMDEYYFPEDIGVPIGGLDEPGVYVLAIHYDNSDYTPGLVDSSGIELTITPQLRRHEGAFLTVGNIISQNWLQFIPPGDNDYVQKAYCSQRCLAWGFLGSGNAIPMTVAAVQFQAHDLAKQMKLRHMTYTGRDRVTENPWIAHDKSYDFEAETLRILKERRSIGFWDNLLLECKYDSTNRDRPTVGGWTSYDELCRAHLLYYPRKTLEGCMSWTSYDKMRNVSGEILPADKVFEALVATDWTNARAMRRNLKRALKRSIEYGQCWSSKQRISYAIDYFRQPRITEPYMEASQTVCPSTRMADAQMFGK